MKRVFSILLCVLTLFCVLSVTALAEDTPSLPGAGTQSDPFRIASKQDLLSFYQLLEQNCEQYGDKYYILTADISFNNGVFSTDTNGECLYNGAPVSFSNAPLVWPGICAAPAQDSSSFAFSGTFDGQGHSISGLFGSGLFGVCRDAYIVDLVIENSVVTDASALLCALADSCTIENCAVRGLSNGSGLAAAAKNSVFLRCSSDAEISSNAATVGGIVGYGIKNRIIYCENDGAISVSCDEQASCSAGGIVGSSGPGDELALCTNRAAIRSSGNAGGICGTFSTLAFADTQNAYIMCANIGSIHPAPLAEASTDLGLPIQADNDSILLIGCYTTGENGGYYYGAGQYDANSGSRQTVTDVLTGTEQTKWISRHLNDAAAEVTQAVMYSDDFPALVNDGYAYILEGLYYQFSADEVGTNNGYPVISQKAAQALTGGTLHKNFVDGTGNGLFCPTTPMSRAEMAQIFYALLDIDDGPAVFSDVPDGKWYTQAVNAMANAGYLSGYPNGTFGPNRSVMRCELIQVLARLSGATLGGRETTFTDVPLSHWAYDAIALAQERGWVMGVGDNTFLPTKTMTRAEAVTAINAFLGRVPDKDCIDANPTARFFLDVQPQAWYYYAVMEAAVSHTAVDTNLGERWNSFSTYPLDLRDGFYLINQNLYLVLDGNFVLSACSGTFAGTEYVCVGSSGICQVSGTLLPLADGTICVLQNGTPWLGRGYFEYEGNWYFGQDNGLLLQNGTWNSLYFDAQGKYSSGNAQIDAHIDEIVASVTNESMTQVQKLRACYDYVYNHVVYQSNNNHVPHGADPSTWTEAYMLRLIERGKGNCYCFAAQMYYLARRVGYAQATAVSGQDCPDGYPVDHGWVEIEIDGVAYLFDPEMNRTRGLAPGALFMIPYAQAPWPYYPA